MTIRLFDKAYHPMELDDIFRDIYECFDPAFNAAAIAIPVDENGSQMGHYRVVVEWIDG